MRDLCDFIGQWSITRVIDDRRAVTQAQLTGVCSFTRSAACADVIQHEVGTLMMPGMSQPISAERRYIWRGLSGKQGSDNIAVHFDDGRFFHSFNANQDAAQAGHDCDPDRYDVLYDFSQWSQPNRCFSARWQVSGPRKDYVSTTKFAFQPSI